jgi:hypothetical protein
VLELRGNQIGVEGIKHIIDALRNSDKIKSLILDWNKEIGQDSDGLNYVKNIYKLNLKLLVIFRYYNFKTQTN